MQPQSHAASQPCCCSIWANAHGATALPQTHPIYIQAQHNPSLTPPWHAELCTCSAAPAASGCTLKARHAVHGRRAEALLTVTLHPVPRTAYPHRQAVQPLAPAGGQIPPKGRMQLMQRACLGPSPLPGTSCPRAMPALCTLRVSQPCHCQTRNPSLPPLLRLLARTPTSTSLHSNSRSEARMLFVLSVQAIAAARFGPVSGGAHPGLLQHVEIADPGRAGTGACPGSAVCRARNHHPRQ